MQFQVLGIELEVRFFRSSGWDPNDISAGLLYCELFYSVSQSRALFRGIESRWVVACKFKAHACLAFAAQFLPSDHGELI